MMSVMESFSTMKEDNMPLRVALGEFQGGNHLCARPIQAPPIVALWVLFEHRGYLLGLVS
jgi:hypothetical protein